jgi:LPS-assembly protein
LSLPAERNAASRLPLLAASGKLIARFSASGSPVRPVLRLLPLPLCIALSLPAHAADDTPQNWALCPIGDAVPPFADAFRAPEGLNVAPAGQPRPTDIEGDMLSGTDANPVFQGNVTMRRDDQFMGADQLTFDKEKGRYAADGSIRYQAAGLRVRAAHAEGDQEAGTHSMQDLQYQLLSRRGNGRARSLDMVGDIGTLRETSYSTCPPEARHWELRASRIDIDTDKGMAVAHGASLRVGKVPVLYMPWFMFPTDDRRRTGLLFPSISNSGRNGFDWKQPIYLNLAPDYDATLSPRWMSKRGALLGGQFRYLLENGKGTLDAVWMPNDELRDRSRGHAHFEGQQNLGPHWQARANLNWISDPRYFEDFSNSVYGLSLATAHSSIGAYGRGRGWTAGIAADHWQLADYTLTDQVLPYDRLPRAFLNWESRVDGLLHTGVDAEAVRFRHPVYAAGSRLDLRPWVGMPLEGDAWFLRPTLAYRYTGYSLDRALEQTLGSGSPTRGQSIFSVDSGLFFDRDTRVKGKNYLQTIEPRLFYLNVPYADQDDMPVFDTQPLTFSWNQLFRENRYSGGDRQADANQLTLAVSTRMIRQSDGFERFSASLGQIRYLKESRVRLPDEPVTEKGGSAWVADVNYAPTDRWNFGASYQYDPKFKRTDLASVRARYLLPDEGVFNLSYRYRRALLEQVDMSFLYPLNPSWSLVSRGYYSLRDRKVLEALAGVQWDSCCVALRLVARRYVHNREGELSNALMFEIELKGLGSAGQDSRKVLRRAILGYNRDDLYLVPPQTATGQPSPPDNANTIP